MIAVLGSLRGIEDNDIRTEKEAIEEKKKKEEVR